MVSKIPPLPLPFALILLIGYLLLWAYIVKVIFWDAYKWMKSVQKDKMKRESGEKNDE